MNKSKKIIIVSAVSVLVIVCILVYVFVFGNKREEEPVTVEITSATTAITTTVPETETLPPETTTEVPEYSYHSGLYLKAQEAHKTNSDVIGWIRISNTNVNYPILQTTNNDFYMDRNLYKEYSRDGYIFMDFRDYFGENEADHSDNLLIYGHNMANGSMFHTLHRYKQRGFYQANPYVEISSLYKDYQYKIYTCMLVNGASGSDFEFWNYVNFPMEQSGNAEAEFNDFKSKVDSHSIFTTGVDLKFGDKILSLSTCNSGSSTDSTRFVTIARRVRAGEDPAAGTGECVMK